MYCYINDVAVAGLLMPRLWKLLVQDWYGMNTQEIIENG